MEQILNHTPREMGVASVLFILAAMAVLGVACLAQIILDIGLNAIGKPEPRPPGHPDDEPCEEEGDEFFATYITDRAIGATPSEAAFDALARGLGG